jgi:hypothetical protein
MSLGKRLRELSIEIAVGVLVVVAAVAYASAKRTGANVPWPSVLFAVYTAVIFGYPVTPRFNHHLKNWLFWVTWAILLLAHLASFFLAFSRLHHWALGYYGLLAPIEAGAVILIVGKLFPKPTNQTPV